MDLVIGYMLFSAVAFNAILLLFVYDAVQEYVALRYQPDEHEDIEWVIG